ADVSAHARGFGQGDAGTGALGAAGLLQLRSQYFRSPRSVIAGPDPAIHLLRETLFAKKMDPRVTPAGDAYGYAFSQTSRKIASNCSAFRSSGPCGASGARWRYR